MYAPVCSFVMSAVKAHSITSNVTSVERPSWSFTFCKMWHDNVSDDEAISVFIVIELLIKCLIMTDLTKSIPFSYNGCHFLFKLVKPWRYLSSSRNNNNNNNSKREERKMSASYKFETCNEPQKRTKKDRRSSRTAAVIFRSLNTYSSFPCIVDRHVGYKSSV